MRMPHPPSFITEVFHLLHNAQVLWLNYEPLIIMPTTFHHILFPMIAIYVVLTHAVVLRRTTD